jgi:hypothetical protein
MSIAGLLVVRSCGERSRSAGGRPRPDAVERDTGRVWRRDGVRARAITDLYRCDERPVWFATAPARGSASTLTHAEGAPLEVAYDELELRP